MLLSRFKPGTKGLAACLTLSKQIWPPRSPSISHSLPVTGCVCHTPPSTWNSPAQELGCPSPNGSCLYKPAILVTLPRSFAFPPPWSLSLLTTASGCLLSLFGYSKGEIFFSASKEFYQQITLHILLSARKRIKAGQGVFPNSFPGGCLLQHDLSHPTMRQIRFFVIFFLWTTIEIFV